MITMLLEDTTSKELNEEDTTILVRVLLASVKKSAGEKIVPSAEQRKTQTFTKAQRVRLQFHFYAAVVSGRYGHSRFRLHRLLVVVIHAGSFPRGFASACG